MPKYRINITTHVAPATIKKIRRNLLYFVVFIEHERNYSERRNLNVSSHSPTALLRTRHQNSNSIPTHVDLTGAPTNRPIWTPRATPTRRQTVAVASARAEELSVPNYLTACPLTAGIRDRATRPLAAVLPTLRIPGLGATRQRVVLASPITAGNQHLLWRVYDSK